MEKCIVCNGKKFITISYNNSDYLFLEEINRNIFSKRSISCCLVCGFSSVWPFIDSKLLSDFYKLDYSREGGPHYEFMDIGHYSWKNYINNRAVAQLMLVSQYKDLSTIKNLLDVGCGVGNTFSMINKMGFYPNCHAIEEGENYSSHLNELNVNVIAPNDEKLGIDSKYENYFDLILLSHSLEHFSAEYINKIVNNIYNYLKNDGILLIEVPNEDCRDNLNERKSSYPYFIAPHVSFFSKKSLEMLLIESGLVIEYINLVGSKENFDNKYENIKNSNLKNYILTIFKFLPPLHFTFKLLRHIVRHIKTLVNSAEANKGINLFKSNEYLYGDKRQAIRVCARKSS